MIMTILNKMVLISAVYAFFHENNEVLYVGSTNNLQRRLFKEHYNPHWNKHGPFGRWLHEDNNLERVTLKILERVKDEENDLQKALVTREFHYKRTLPKQKFGKLDGLGLQSPDLQLKIRRERTLEKNKDNSNFKPRGPQKPPTTQKQKEILARRRQLHKEKLEKAGKKYKARKLKYEYTPEINYITKERAAYLKVKREEYKKKVEAQGRVYKPRSSKAQRSIVTVSAQPIEKNTVSES